MTRTCQSCGSALSARYVRVVFPDGVVDPPYCCHCPDRPIANCHRRKHPDWVGVADE